MPDQASPAGRLAGLAAMAIPALEFLPTPFGRAPPYK
jgi:hypothetical protein